MSEFIVIVKPIDKLFKTYSVSKTRYENWKKKHG